MTEEVISARLKERKYLLSYVLAVGQEVGKSAALRILCEVETKSRLKWARNALLKLDITKNDARAGQALMDAHSSLIPSVGLKKKERVEYTPNRVVVRHYGYCAIIEACKALEIEPKDICPYWLYPAIDAVIKELINPKLSIKVTKIRPKDNCCEHLIELS